MTESLAPLALASGRLHFSDRQWRDEEAVIRIVWLTAGMVSLALGGLGIVLPLLPTTPLVILAAFCFARSSPAFHDRLLNSPTFGPAIRDWRDNRAISRKGKIAAVCAMLAAMLISIALGIRPAILAVQGVALLAAATFVLSRNTAR